MNTNNQETSIEQYEFEPIKGYPMLNWKGKRPFRSTQFYPAQIKETYGDSINGWINKIFWGDNLQVMSHLLKEYRGKIKLIYIDPPFDSKADYKKKISLRGKNVLNDHNSFEEKQYTDIWSNDDYLQFMYERLILIKELLSEDGNIFVHCDEEKNYQLRCILDEIFSPSNFRNEIIWKRSTSTGLSTKKCGALHDTIYWYSKSQNYTFNMQYHEYDEKYLKRARKDENDRLYIPIPTGNPGPRPNLYYNYKGYWPHQNGYKWTYEKMEEFDKEGRLIFPDDKKGRIQYKQYLDEMQGVKLQDIWLDIPAVNPVAQERNGYPTQKPEALLERIIKMGSNAGDLIFDCFMGSGTTQAVAMKTGRRFLGTDINLGAIQTTTKRLIKASNDLEIENPDQEIEAVTLYTGFSISNVNNYDVFRNPVQAKEILIEALEIQPILNNAVYDGEKDGKMVKIMPVNRIATRADLNELITNFDYKLFEKRQQEHPNQPVEKLLLICMGHESDLAAALEQEVGYKLDVEVVDILRDKSNLEFRRDSEAEILVEDNKLIINNFYPMNLLQKLSIMKENVEDWKELVESIIIDWNYDGAVLEPTVVDIPDKNEVVTGIYNIPESSGTIRIKITDLLSESLEVSIDNG
ncbi:site-specific DNA-methyltransferase [Priestia endophytica]|uniref:Adenine-specific DNA-methyltransferase n=1 Tax=Priestia endophytica DSM 13796 TaxID=1121089 RepID=A0A1I5YPV2_9BACI|nr:site-specific DNA-methyltransferase [Priestia endophytica]KYG33626.1 DNA methylase [Priestia endophytica]SFQ46085.1 adenine-specific DNA-methyltransferase [Priestia endophytica DSM 13796]